MTWHFKRWLCPSVTANMIPYKMLAVMMKNRENTESNWFNFIFHFSYVTEVTPDETAYQLNLICTLSQDHSSCDICLYPSFFSPNIPTLWTKKYTH